MMKENIIEKRGRKSSRDLILKEAFKLFLQKNIEKVTVPDIEKATGIQRGAIFYHFKDKKALFIEAIDQYFFSNLNIFYPLNPEGLSSFQEYIKKKNECLKAIINWFHQENVIANPYVSFFHLTSQASLYYPTFEEKMNGLLNMDKACWRKAAQLDKVEDPHFLIGKYIGDIYRSIYIERCFSGCYGASDILFDESHTTILDLF